MVREGDSLRQLAEEFVLENGFPVDLEDQIHSQLKKAASKYMHKLIP